MCTFENKSMHINSKKQWAVLKAEAEGEGRGGFAVAQTPNFGRSNYVDQSKGEKGVGIFDYELFVELYASFFDTCGVLVVCPGVV